jgi:hypothetical protein
MEDNNQGNDSSDYEVVDLSNVLSERDGYAGESHERKRPKSKSILNNFLMEHSGGLIRSEKQAQFVSVLLIIAINLLTFLIVQGLGTGVPSTPTVISVPGTQSSTTIPVPAAAN